MEITREIMDALSSASALIFPEDIEAECNEYFEDSSVAYFCANELRRCFAKKGIVETYREYSGDSDMQSIICALLTRIAILMRLE